MGEKRRWGIGEDDFSSVDRGKEEEEEEEWFDYEYGNKPQFTSDICLSRTNKKKVS